MIRNLLATVAVAALMSAAGSTAHSATTTSTTSATTTDQAAMSDAHLASKLIGKKVYNGSDDNAASIGSVDDVLINKSGSVDAIIVGVGGFLGMGQKDVAVPYNTVNWVDKNGDRWLVINTTSDQLKSQAAFDRSTYDAPSTASNSAATNSSDTTNTASTNMAPAAGSDTTGSTNTAAAPATGTDSNSSMATADQNSMMPVDPGKIRSQDIVGTIVYGADNANVGSIGDIVLTKDGKVDAVIIDVGGFLGMGQKPVAVAMEKFKFMEDKNGKRYLYTDFTKDQLKAQPAYDKTTWTDKRDAQRMVSP